MNLKKGFGLILVGLIFLGSVFILLDYLITTDAEKIDSIIIECKKGIEAENSNVAIKYVSDQYTDNYGLSKEKLKEIAENVFSKFEDFKVIIEKKELQIDKDKATLEISFRIMVTYNGQRTFLFGDLNKPAHAILLFKKTEENEKNWSIFEMKELETRWPIGVYKRD
jgi:hypothetical protein